MAQRSALLRVLSSSLATIAVLTSSSVPAAAQATPVVPAGYRATLLTTGLNFPKGITSALLRQGAGQLEDWLYVAESGADRIVRVSRQGGPAVSFATSASFPVGVNIAGGPFGPYVYIGNAFAGGITRADPSGTVSPFSLAAHPVAGMDFGHGQYGADLYIGEWPFGIIWRVTRDGTASPFATVPGAETRYLKFSRGGAFGTYLYFSDIVAGRIYRVAPDGAATVFAQLASPCLEGFEISPGGTFGQYLYVGDVCTGDIFRVAADGSSTRWASGFEGVSDIHFQAGKAGGFTMYLTDTGFGFPGNGKVYAIAVTK